jgi:hypothetical protein
MTSGLGVDGGERRDGFDFDARIVGLGRLGGGDCCGLG